MESKKSNAGLYVLIGVLCVLVLLLGGYFVYDKVLNNKETPVENNNINDINNIEEEKLPEWAQYLLNQNISEIIVNNRKFESFDPEVGCPETEKITKEQLRSVLEVMVKSQLSNYKNASGFGGPCMESIVIKYNNNQEFKFLLYKYIVTEDNQIKSLLEKERYTINNSLKGDEIYDDMFAYEWDSSFLDTLF